MTLVRWIVMSTALLALTTSMGGGSVGSVRICGRHLADLLNFICEKNGGFHAPKVRRTAFPEVSRRRGTLLEILRSSINRRNEPSEESADIDMVSNQGGVVDECCHRQCTLSTLASYCANARADEVDMEEIVSSEQENTLDQIPQQNEAESLMVQEQVTASPPTTGVMATAVRPNLGLFSRDRPVFIVLSQLQEDEDHLLGEYRF